MKAKTAKSRTAAARGKCAVLVEMTTEQKEELQKAADTVGIKPAQFLRTYGLKEAKKINSK